MDTLTTQSMSDNLWEVTAERVGRLAKMLASFQRNHANLLPGERDPFRNPHITTNTKDYIRKELL